MPRRPARLFGAEPEATQPGRYVVLLGRPGASLSQGLGPFARHEPCPERALRPVLVVRPAAKPQTLHARAASAGDLQNVIELQKPPLLAAPARRADERAARPVARPDSPLDVR